MIDTSNEWPEPYFGYYNRYHDSGWMYQSRLGWKREGDDNLYIWGRMRIEGKLSDWALWFWDWSQTGPDSCYGSGKWMPVTDQWIIDSFPEEWKRIIEEERAS